MIIRKATLNDAKGIAKVHVDSWKTTYANIMPVEYLNQLSYEERERLWEKNMTNSDVFIAENAEGKIIGFSSGGKERSNNYPGYIGELYAIYILKEYQGNGLGKLLVKPIIKKLHQKNLFSMVVLVLEDNPSRLFYEALDGKKIDTIEINIAGKKLDELVYGWKDSRTIL